MIIIKTHKLIGIRYKKLDLYILKAIIPKINSKIISLPKNKLNFSNSNINAKKMNKDNKILEANISEYLVKIKDSQTRK